MRNRLRMGPPRRGGRWRLLLSGVGLGSALFYFLDPVRGRARRARAHDQALKAVHHRRREVRRFERDLTNRAYGFVARLRAALRPETPDDEVVKERVRSALGRLLDHAGAIEVAVDRGQVRLAGPIAEREHARILGEIARVRGVRAVEIEPPHAGHGAQRATQAPFRNN
ncbi:MAG TPA: BON domain-containing protein [Polyangia bacterium]|nr:BON domain-containing protein [Polyangia bacterium]